MRDEEARAGVTAVGPPIVVGLPERREVGDGWAELAAPIDWGGENPGLPDRAYVSVPAAQAQFLATRSDPFFIFMLMTAMRLRRPLHVRGEVSARLGAGAAEFMRIFAAGHPGRYGVVPLEAEWTSRPPERVGTAVATSFSGGLDSFHTLFRRTREGILAGERVSHAIFISGFDFDPVEERAYYRAFAREYAETVAERGVELLLIETNFRRFFTNVQWLTTHGCALAACAHALSGLIGAYWIPASIPGEEWRWPPWGTDAWTDYLLGSENLQILHDGLNLDRTQKAVELAGWDTFLRTLRVCLHPPPGGRNCGQCEKCRRTMVHLEIAGCLDRATAFEEKDRRDPWSRVTWSRPGLNSTAWSTRREALAAGRPDVARKLVWVGVRDVVRTAKRYVRRKLRSG